MRKINIFLGAILLSIWSVVLFFGKEIGFSMLLFVVPISYYIVSILEKNNKVKNKNSKSILIPIIIISGIYLIYNNSFFNTVNLIVIPILIIIMILNLLTDKLMPKTLLEKILDIIIEPFAYIGETMSELKNNLSIKFNIKQNKETNQSSNNIFKALCITIPIVIVIVAILASADSVFNNMIFNILNVFTNIFSSIDFSGFIIRLILIICIYIYISSFFYNITKYEEEPVLENDTNESKKIESMTLKMVLTALNIVYLIFCIIQINSLFMQKTNINYADYARQGFFQLMIVSIINLIVILIAKKYGEENNKYINFMEILMIIFTFIIIVSSAVRMYFYEQAYGYTLLRLLVYCVLLTEAILLIPTILYILNKHRNLIKTYFTIIVVMYIGMNIINFDAIIANRNINRYIETGKIDLEYLEKETGTDAISNIIEILEIENADDTVKKETLRYIDEVYTNLKNENTDFRNFNLSKLLSKKAIEEIR